MKVNEYIQKYLYSIQSILLYKQDAYDFSTPYQLEINRQNAHNELVKEYILPMLKLDSDSSDTDVYVLTKYILSNLDKVWKIYDDTEFDLTNNTCLKILSRYLEKLFTSTECKYFLEGKTKGLRGITYNKTL